MKYDQAVELIIDSLREGLNETDDEVRKLAISQADEDTRLFGGDGLLDSMGVVILLSDLEEQLDDKYDVMISLANDSTMSKTRSPFRSVKSLAKYILVAVEEEKK